MQHLTAVGLLWLRKDGHICFTKGKQVRVIGEGFYHYANDLQSIQKQIPESSAVSFPSPSLCSSCLHLLASLSCAHVLLLMRLEVIESGSGIH